MLSSIAPYKEQLSRLCQEYPIARLFLFGSATNASFMEQSDIDLIVQFDSTDMPPEEKGQLYWDLLDDLEKLFGRKVDLLTDKNFSNPYFREEVEAHKILIFDCKTDKEILI